MAVYYEPPTHTPAIMHPGLILRTCGDVYSISTLRACVCAGSRTNTVLVQDMVVDMSPVSTIDPTPRFLAYTNTQPLPPAPPSAQGTYSHTFTTSPKSARRLLSTRPCFVLEQ